MLYIVTTTINPPTEATKRYAKIAESRDDVQFIIVGDRKTNIPNYTKLFENNNSVFIYTPAQQEKDFPELSSIIGWNTIQRRNLGFAYIYKHSVDHKDDFIATVDDDNIPYNNWLQPYIDIEDNSGKIWVSHIDCVKEYGDPLSVLPFFIKNDISHRGFLRKYKSIPNLYHTRSRTCRSENIDVIAALWDGAPDIDAIDRYKINNQYVSITDEFNIPSFNNAVDTYYKFNNSKTVFNSQNTFIRVKLLPYYMCIPYVGRMDDIWGAYLLQTYMPDIGIVFAKPTVYQERNEHNVFKDISLETHGYMANDFSVDLLSSQSLNCYETYYETLIKYKKES